MEYQGWRMKGRGVDKKTPIEVGRRPSAVWPCARSSLGADIPFYRSGMSDWSGAKIQLFSEPTKKFSEKLILKAAERILQY